MMGLFSKKKKEPEKADEITPAVKAKLDEFAQRAISLRTRNDSKKR